MSALFKKFLSYQQDKHSLVNESINNVGRKILFVFPMGIGNTILTSSAVNSMRQLCPSAQFYAMYREAPTLDAIKMLGPFNKIHHYDRSMGVKKIFQLIYLLRKSKYDVVVIFFKNINLNLPLLFFISGIPIRVGFKYWENTEKPGASFFLTHAISYSWKEPEFQNDLKLVELLGKNANIHVPLVLQDDHKIKIEPDKLNIGVHIGAVAKRPGWPVSCFVKLIELINNKYKNVTVYVFGGPDEKKNLELSDIIGGRRVINLIGKCTLCESAYYISKMCLFISNDTGLMHIAASGGVPLIAIFGPTDCIKSRPNVTDDSKLKIIRKNLPCQPCYSIYARNIKCNHFQCLSLISPEEVFKEVVAFMGTNDDVKE